LVRESRRQVVAVVLAQVAFGGVVALACFGLWGTRAGASALLGAAVGVTATFLMAFALLRHGPGASASRVAWSLFSGWLVKIGFTVAVLILAFRSPRVDAVPLLGAYVATFLGYWLGAVRAGGQKTEQTVGVAD
jgi:F0F1-type ATP synthase assembly protein I